jgi:hypothetical protein
MAFDLNQFRNKLVGGGARPSQFEMLVYPPQALLPTSYLAFKDLPFFCSIAQIPTQTITTVQVPYFGRKLKYAGEREYPELTVTILNDEDYKLRHAFEDWMRQITGTAVTTSNFNGGLWNRSYAGSAEVVQHSRNNHGGGPQQRYTFVGLYPVTLGEISLDWNSNDQIETFSVSFNYQWWEVSNPLVGI